MRSTDVASLTVERFLDWPEDDWCHVRLRLPAHRDALDSACPGFGVYDRDTPERPLLLAMVQHLFTMHRGKWPDCDCCADLEARYLSAGGSGSA